ncbi:MAG: WYL domain-containing protein [Eggerthellales bacterium]|nr:WYL domain-containing protein [Eggerthellales bacterium]
MATDKQKVKLLHIAELLFKETDESHGVTMAQIIEYLAERGVQAERKSVYRDIDVLKEFGLDIVKLRTAPTSYALANRPLSRSELVLLIDAVQSSRFLTKSKSDELVRSLKSLGSRNQVRDLNKRVHVDGRIKTQNESVFYNVDAIQNAIAEHRKLQFKYFTYNLQKSKVLRREGKDYVVTPVSLIYSEGCYYLISFSDKYQSLTTYRVDRMTEIRISDEPATRNEIIATFDVSDYEQRVFGMFGGDPTTAVLLVQESAMGSVIDRFGRNVMCYPADDNRARVTVQILESKTFYGWLAQFGEQIELEGPAKVRENFVSYLEDILSIYRRD